MYIWVYEVNSLNVWVEGHKEAQSMQSLKSCYLKMLCLIKSEAYTARQSIVALKDWTGIMYTITMAMKLIIIFKKKTYLICVQ